MVFTILVSLLSSSNKSHQKKKMTVPIIAPEPDNISGTFYFALPFPLVGSDFSLAQAGASQTEH